MLGAICKVLQSSHKGRRESQNSLPGCTVLAAQAPALEARPAGAARPGNGELRLRLRARLSSISACLLAHCVLADGVVCDEGLTQKRRRQRCHQLVQGSGAAGLSLKHFGRWLGG